jgi:hypothetical protein
MKWMNISRREFLKLASVSAAGLGLGLGAGRLAYPAPSQGLALQAFLPDDPTTAAALLAGFTALTGRPEELLIYDEAGWAAPLRAASTGEAAITARGVTILVVKRLGASLPADLLLSDDRTAVYDPVTQLGERLAVTRRSLRGQLAVWAFSAAHHPTLRGGQRRVAVLRDGRGLVDRLPLSGAYRDIPLDGSYGQTHLRLENGQVWVQSASCRHRQCQQVGRLSMPGERAACAPNRLLVEIEWE